MDADYIKRLLMAMAICMALAWGWTYLTKMQQKDSAKSTTTPTRQVKSAKPHSTTKARRPQTEAKPPIESDWKLATPQKPANSIILGQREKQEGGYKAEITISSNTTALETVLLSEHKLHVDDTETGYPLLSPGELADGSICHSLMLGQMELGQQGVFNLAGDCWSIGEIVRDELAGHQSASFIARIVDKEGKDVLHVVKTYRYSADSYQLGFDLSFINKTNQDITISSLEMYGPMGLLREDPRSDRRYVTAAYADIDGKLELESTGLSKVTSKPEEALLDKPKTAKLKWFGTSNKFFATIVRPNPQDIGKSTYVDGGLVYAEQLAAAETAKYNTTIGTYVTLADDNPITPGSQTDFVFSIYLGSINKDIFDGPEYAGLGYEKLLKSRSCSFCVFEPLTFLLLKCMNICYQLTRNYGIAVIVLVFLVRLIMHPISKKSQVNMMKMSKLAPRMEEIKQKYANNKAEMQKQMVAVQKEQAPAMLWGCLPMALQMPIWIALYTAVDANVALRHEGLLPASWHWLTDLSAPDRLIPFSVFGVNEPVSIPLLSNFMGSLDAINLLPVLLAVVMFLQQKLSPQKAMAQSNPQAAQQQKMMLIMMPAMMFLFLYNAPSALNLYIMASISAGILEQKRIRKHLKEKEEKEQTDTIVSTKKIKGKSAPKKPKDRPPTRFS